MLSSSPAFSPGTLGEALALLRRPQPVTLPMVALATVMPFYLYIGHLVHGGPVHIPAVELDDLIPASAAWAPVYLSLFLAALLPAFVLHQQDLIRRTVLAYLAAWLAAFVFFVAWPTVGTRPPTVEGDGFLEWMLRTIYAADAPYNCFPSLHVAQCFLAAFACSRVHRGVGFAAGAWATTVALSTLFTKQHYVADVIGGVVLAYLSYLAFLRSFPRKAVPADERRLAPVLAVGAAATYAVMLAIMWVAYALGVVVQAPL